MTASSTSFGLTKADYYPNHHGMAPVDLITFHNPIGLSHNQKALCKQLRKKLITVIRSEIAKSVNKTNNVQMIFKHHFKRNVVNRAKESEQDQRPSIASVYR